MLKKTFWKIYSFYYWKIINYLSEHELFGLYYMKLLKQPKVKLKLKNTEALGKCPYCHKWIDGSLRSLYYTQNEKDEIKATIECMEASILDLKDIDNHEIANVDPRTRRKVMN